jgi:hypothetical protein
VPAPSISIRLLPRLALRQDSATEPLLARLTALHLIIILFRTRGQATAHVGGQLDPGGRAAVRHARTPRQAHRDLAPRVALHVVDHHSSNTRAVA